jgi:hypothetical protein
VKLDPDLARDLLLKVDQAPPNHSAKDLQVEGRDKDEVFEHLELLHEAGLIEARIVKSGMGGARVLTVMVERMTWEAQHSTTAIYVETSKGSGRFKGSSVDFRRPQVGAYEACDRCCPSLIDIAWPQPNVRWNCRAVCWCSLRSLSV